MEDKDNFSVIDGREEEFMVDHTTPLPVKEVEVEGKKKVVAGYKEEVGMLSHSFLRLGLMIFISLVTVIGAFLLLLVIASIPILRDTFVLIGVYVVIKKITPKSWKEEVRLFISELSQALGIKKESK